MQQASVEPETHSWIVKLLLNKLSARVVLATSIIITVLAWHSTKLYSDRFAEERFEGNVREISNAISHRMVLYEQALWGGVGLFNASVEVTRDEWRKYVNSLKIQKNLPGIQGIGFARVLAPGEVPEFENNVRAEGFPEFSISPPGEREAYSSILFLEPFDWRNQRAFGYDMWSNETRRAAMARARDTGVAATSGMVRLVQETNEQVQAGFLTYLPVYENTSEEILPEDRKGALVGWVYSPFRANDLMEGILGSQDLNFHLSIYDGEKVDSESLLYQSSDEIGNVSDRHTSTVNLVIQGRPWTLKVQATEKFVKSTTTKIPMTIAAGGLIIDALLFYLIWVIYGLHQKANALAEGMTKELAESNWHLKQFAYAATHDVKSPLNSIGNALLLLEKESSGFSERANKALDWIRKGHKRAINILDKLAQIVQMKETGPLPFQMLDIGSEIRQISEGFAGDLAACGGEIHHKNCSGTLFFPRSVFESTLENLISNSIKYRNPDHPLHITVSFQEEKNGPCLFVEDNGLGFDSKIDTEKVFAMFRRLHGNIDGAGIGLYMVKQSLEFHGAEITCESEKGKGCLFRVQFPLNVGEFDHDT